MMTGKHWTVDEIAYLKEYYTCKTSLEIAKNLNRSVDSVNLKANRIGLRRPPPPYLWTNEHIEYLKTHYINTPFKEMCTYLDRASEGITQKANKLGLYREGKWTKKERDYLCKNYPKGNPHKICKKLNRSLSSIHHKAIKLGLQRECRYAENYSYKIKIPKPSNDFAWFLGVLAGDGNVNETKVRLNVVTKEFSIKFKEIGEKLFGIKGHYYIVKPNSRTKNKQTQHQILFSSVRLSKYLGDWRGDSSIWIDTMKKRFPWVLSKDCYKLSFINGLFDSEGSVSTKRCNVPWDNVCIMITAKPKRSRLFIIGLLNDLGCEPIENGYKACVGKKVNAKRLAKLLNSCIPHREKRLATIRKTQYVYNSYNCPVVE